MVITRNFYMSTLVATGLLFACVTANAQHERAKGAGLGALVGQVIGGDTEATLIGAGVGAGIGHVIKKKGDKEEAEQLAAESEGADYRHDDVDELGDTAWKLESLNTDKEIAPYTAKVFLFRPDGHLVTVTVTEDGETLVSREIYRVVDDTLVINKPGYLVNARFSIDDDLLIVSAQEFSAVLKKLDDDTAEIVSDLEEKSETP